MPSEAVMERGLEAIKTFLRDVLEAEKVTCLHLFKVVLVVFCIPSKLHPVGERELRCSDRSEGGDCLHANILKLATLFTIYSSTSLFKRRPSNLAAGDLDAPSVQRLRNIKPSE